eukprot:scaffold9408_cov35-Tisochrysis_lutea.AAC.1
MLAMLCPLVLSFRELARGVHRAHLGRGFALSRVLRVRGRVEHGLIVRRGGGGVRRRGERRTLHDHDPIVLTTVEDVDRSDRQAPRGELEPGRGGGPEARSPLAELKLRTSEPRWPRSCVLRWPSQYLLDVVRPSTRDSPIPQDPRSAPRPLYDWASSTHQFGVGD